MTRQPHVDQIFDLDRVNQCLGIAAGETLAAYFRAGASRMLASIEACQYKKNRLGSVMLHSHVSWDSSSQTTQFLPQLDSTFNDAALARSSVSANIQ